MPTSQIPTLRRSITMNFDRTTASICWLLPHIVVLICFVLLIYTFDSGLKSSPESIRTIKFAAAAIVASSFPLLAHALYEGFSFLFIINDMVVVDTHTIAKRLFLAALIIMTCILMLVVIMWSNTVRDLFDVLTLSQMLLLCHALLGRGFTYNLVLKKNSSVIAMDTITKIMSAIGFVLWRMAAPIAALSLHVIVSIYAASYFLQSFPFKFKSTIELSPRTLGDTNWQLMAYILVISVNWIIFICGNNAVLLTSSSSDWPFFVEVRTFYLLAFTTTISFFYNNHTKSSQPMPQKSAAQMNSDFVRFVSHELRSHISHLSLGLQILRDDTKPYEKIKLVAIGDLQDTCDISTQVLNDILIFTDMRLGATESDSEVIPCSKALTTALRNQVKHVSFTCSFFFAFFFFFSFACIL